MSTEFFAGVGPIGHTGRDADDPFSFEVYDPDREVLGARMEDHFRIAVGGRS